MRTNKLYLLLLLLVFACGKADDKLPSNILTRDQMVPVLADIQLVEAAITNKNLLGDSAKRYATDCYDFVYKQHKVNRILFESSLNYYLLHPKDLDLIYTEVIAELSQKEALEAK